MELLQLLSFFSHTYIFNGLAGYCPHREGSPAPGIAVQFGQNDTVGQSPFSKALGNIHRILASHGVENKDYFHRLDKGLNLQELLHEGLIQVHAAGGVKKQAIMLRFLRPGQGIFRQFNGLKTSWPIAVYLGVNRSNFQLIHSCGTIGVQTDDDGLFAFGLEHPS